MTLDRGTCFGPYEVTGHIGSGGMGDVYRATDTKLGRDVAIKTLPAALASDKDRLARFEREARLLASLNHPHIAAVYGLDEHEGTLYLAMEIVEGETLEEKLKAGALAVDDALRLGLQIAEALEAAHGKGVVHRDLKPANVMVTPGGQVKVLDFGLAKAFSGDPDAASPAQSPALSLAMTQQGLVLGTAGYMAPEQASGQATDQRADIWAFGVVVYEMLTGLPLFTGESVPHILADVLKTEPDWSRLPKNLHPRLKLMLERCLEKRPRDRYHSIADARIDIEKILSDPAGVKPGPVAEGRVPQRSIAVRAGAAVGLAVLAAAAGWILKPETPPAPRPVTRFVYQVPGAQNLRGLDTGLLGVSPTGRHFAYNTGAGFYLRSLDELEARLIPGTEGTAFRHPFFSADGKSVAAYDGNQLKRIAITGGVPVAIADIVPPLAGASWAFDDTILFGQGGGIYRVSATAGEPRLVIAAQDGEMLADPILLPDGDTVLFSAAETGPGWEFAKIAAQSLSTGERSTVVERGMEPSLLPGGVLLFVVGGTLFGSAFDPETLTVSGGPVPLVQNVRLNRTQSMAEYGVADDGTLVYFSADFAALGDQNTLVAVDGAGSEMPLGLDSCACTQVALSPDGSRIAAIMEPGGGADDVWIASLARGRFTRLTFEPGFKVAPIWSPDGERIAYGTQDGIYVRRADGAGKAERILEGQRLRPWSWSRDGELFYTAQATALATIGRVAVDGPAEPRLLLDEDFNVGTPAISPDGAWMAYASSESGTTEVYVRPYPAIDTGQWQVSNGGGQQPKWSADGTSLLYRNNTQTMRASITTEGGFEVLDTTPIFDHQPYLTGGFLPTFDVDANGDRWIMIKAAGPSARRGAEIVIVENWIEEAKRLVADE